MRLGCLTVIAFLLSASVAFGDGCYIPERAVRKIPEIVAQHAVLSWKDGVETLVQVLQGKAVPDTAIFEMQAEGSEKPPEQPAAKPSR